jgi:glycerophosphoryl diester phosphodiesterase
VVLVIAHRGAPRLARENTVESFSAAVAAGAGAIELDVRRTADDHLVVHHDALLEDGGRSSRARATGFAVNTWTTNDADRATELAAWLIDGFWLS